MTSSHALETWSPLTFKTATQNLCKAIEELPNAKICEKLLAPLNYYLVEFSVPGKGYFIVYTYEAAIKMDNQYYLNLIQLNKPLDMFEATKCYSSCSAIIAIGSVAMRSRSRISRTTSPFSPSWLARLVSEAKEI